MAADMLSVLVLEDENINVTYDLAKFYFNCLVSDHIELRRVRFFNLMFVNSFQFLI